MFGVLAGLGAAAGSGFTAYQNQLAQEEQAARQRELHALRMQEAAHEAAARNRAEDTRLALATAAAPVVPVSGEVYQPEVDDEGNAMPANPTVGMQRIASGPLMSPQDAAAAAARQNTMPARARRQGEALASMGQLGEARKLDDAATLMEKEGHLAFIDENFAHMPRPEEIAAGKTTFPLAGVDKFNSVGQSRIPEGAVGRAMLRKLPTGQEVPDFEVVDATGKPIAPSARQYEEAYGMTRGERRADLRQQFSDKLSAEDKAERRSILKMTLDERAEDRKDRTADRTADNARADRQLDGQLGYWNSMAGAANTRAEKTGASKSSYERMPEADRKIYDAAEHSRRDIQKDINRAKADGTWAPDKNAAQRSLQADYDASAVTLRSLDQKWGSPATAADPAGLRATPEAGAAPAAGTVPNPFDAASAPASAPRGRASMAVTAAEQTRRDAEAGAMRLRSEYGGDLNRARADLTVLDAQAGKAAGEARTILRMDADRLRAAIAAAERTTAAPAATPQSATVPARTPAPGQAQPSPQEPVQRAAAAVDAARQAAQAAQAQLARYTPMQGRMDPAGWAAARTAAATAEAARERAEQDYRAVAAAQPATSSPAFSAQRRR